MARRCELTEKGVLSGNKVSHSNHKTRRRFLPNIQSVSMLSDALGHAISLRLAASTVRTVEHNGGLDAYLLGTTSTKLSEEGQRLKRRVKKAMAAKQA